MTRCPSCCCCLSGRSLAVFVALVVLLAAVVNPALNRLADLIVVETPLEKEMERYKEMAENRPPFDSAVTDVVGYGGMNFVKEGRQMELHMGLTFIMMQSFPRWAVKLMNLYDPVDVGDVDAQEKKPVDILDARKAGEVASSTFSERGFTLLDMGDAPSVGNVKNWRSQGAIEEFQKDLEPRLLGLYPGATRIDFTYSVIRGGSMFGDQPAAVDGPHLDYSQNDTARKEFHDEYPWMFGQKEVPLLLGHENTEDEEMRVLLGIWKPVMMSTPVCDHPLAVMDARTFSPEREGVYPIHINFGLWVHNLNGAIHHDEDQKWYYYPFQEESEVLVFTQYTKGRHFCTPHGSFVNPNCPEDMDKRVSMEMRAAVFFKKGE